MSPLVRCRRQAPGAVLAAALVLAVASPIASSAPAEATAPSGDGAAARRSTMVLSELVLWPNPDDHYGTTETTLTTTIDQPGEYEVWVTHGRAIENEHAIGDVGDVSPETPYQDTWTWDGRDENNDPAPRGTYRMLLMRHHSSNSYDVVARTEQFEVHNGRGAVVVRDKTHEPNSGPVDVTWFTLVNSPTEVSVEWDFRTRARSHLQGLTAGIDVSGARRGYYLSVTRSRTAAGPAFVPRLLFVLLNSDDDRVKRVPCRAIDVSVKQRNATVTIPRKCLRVGRDQARAYYAVSANDRAYSYDWGPASSSTFTPWVAYEVPPSR